MEAPSILLVDSDALQRSLIDLLLAPEGYRIAEAASGREALQALKGGTPSLVLLQAELADIDGFEICRRLRRVSRLRSVRVLLTVDPDGGLEVEEARRRAREAGADLLLPKPLGDKDLPGKVRALLAGQDPYSSASRPREEVAGDHPGGAPSRPEGRAGDAAVGQGDKGDSLGQDAGELLRWQRLAARLEQDNLELRRQLEAAGKAAADHLMLQARLTAAERELNELRKRNELLLQALEEAKRNPPRGRWRRR